MATVNLGRIKFVWQGAYSGATAYVADDVVSYNGSSYICILASTGNLPTNTTYWNLMAQTGTDITSIAGLAQGDVLYYNGTSWVRLGAGTSGQFLKTNGSGANPAWATVQAGVLAVTSFTNSTRTTLSSNTTTDYEIWNGTVTRTSATSNMHMFAILPMFTSTNHPNIGNFSKLNTTRKRAGNMHVQSGNCSGMWVNTYFSSADLGATTGSIAWAIGWNHERNTAGDTGSTVKPFEVWNYNGSDDNRGTQSVSQLIITEYGV
jgi:hypothetical protein